MNSTMTDGCTIDEEEDERISPNLAPILLCFAYLMNFKEIRTNSVWVTDFQVTNLGEMNAKEIIVWKPFLSKIVDTTLRAEKGNIIKKLTSPK